MRGFVPRARDVLACLLLASGGALIVLPNAVSANVNGGGAASRVSPSPEGCPYGFNSKWSFGFRVSGEHCSTTTTTEETTTTEVTTTTAEQTTTTEPRCPEVVYLRRPGGYEPAGGYGHECPTTTTTEATTTTTVEATTTTTEAKTTTTSEVTTTSGPTTSVGGDGGSTTTSLATTTSLGGEGGSTTTVPAVTTTIPSGGTTTIDPGTTTVPGAVTTTPSTPPGPLPETGSSPASAAVLGGVLVLLGGAVLLLGRRQSPVAD
jgi:LPXTG-motif cell wall-anchored protein